mgnify:CR=1 FL=1
MKINTQKETSKVDWIDRRLYFGGFFCVTRSLRLFYIFQYILDTLVGIQNAADGTVMVQCINHQRDVFAHLAADIV